MGAEARGSLCGLSLALPQRRGGPAASPARSPALIRAGSAKRDCPEGRPRGPPSLRGGSVSPHSRNPFWHAVLQDPPVGSPWPSPGSSARDCRAQGPNGAGRIPLPAPRSPLPHLTAAAMKLLSLPPAGSSTPGTAETAHSRCPDRRSASTPPPCGPLLPSPWRCR
jgi:hypothetical protein